MQALEARDVVEVGDEEDAEVGEEVGQVEGGGVDDGGEGGGEAVDLPVARDGLVGGLWAGGAGVGVRGAEEVEGEGEGKDVDGERDDDRDGFERPERVQKVVVGRIQQESESGDVLICSSLSSAEQCDARGVLCHLIQSYPAPQAAVNCTTFHPSNAPTCQICVASRLAVANSNPVTLAVKVCSSTLRPRLSAQTARNRIACGMRVTAGTMGGSGRGSIALVVVRPDEGLTEVENWSSGRTARKGTWEAIGGADGGMGEDGESGWLVLTREAVRRHALHPFRPSRSTPGA